MKKLIFTLLLTTTFIGSCATNTWAMLDPNQLKKTQESDEEMEETLEQIELKRQVFDMTRYGFSQSSPDDYLIKGSYNNHMTSASTKNQCGDKECKKHNKHNCKDKECGKNKHDCEKYRGGHFCANIYGLSSQLHLKKNWTIDDLLKVPEVKVFYEDLKSNWDNLSDDTKKDEDPTQAAKSKNQAVINALNCLLSQLDGLRTGEVSLQNHRILERAVMLPAFLTVYYYCEQNGMVDEFEKNFLLPFYTLVKIANTAGDYAYYFTGNLTEEDNKKKMQKLINRFDLHNLSYSYDEIFFDETTNQGKEVLEAVKQMFGYLEEDILKKKFKQEATITILSDNGSIKLPSYKELNITKLDVIDDSKEFNKKFKNIISGIKTIDIVTNGSETVKNTMTTLNTWLFDEDRIKDTKKVKGKSPLYEAVSKALQEIDTMTLSGASKLGYKNKLIEIFTKWQKEIAGSKGVISTLKEENIKTSTTDAVIFEDPTDFEVAFNIFESNLDDFFNLGDTQKNRKTVEKSTRPLEIWIRKLFDLTNNVEAEKLAGVVKEANNFVTKARLKTEEIVIKAKGDEYNQKFKMRPLILDLCKKIEESLKTLEIELKNISLNKKTVKTDEELIDKGTSKGSGLLGLKQKVESGSSKNLFDGDSKDDSSKQKAKTPGKLKSSVINQSNNISDGPNDDEDLNQPSRLVDKKPISTAKSSKKVNDESVQDYFNEDDALKDAVDFTNISPQEGYEAIVKKVNYFIKEKTTLGGTAFKIGMGKWLTKLKKDNSDGFNEIKESLESYVKWLNKFKENNYSLISSKNNSFTANKKTIDDIIEILEKELN